MKAFVLLMGFATAFLITAGGSLGCVLVATNGGRPNFWALMSCIAVGVVAGAKDTRSQMQLPPLSNGNMEALKQLYSTKTPQQNNETKTP